MTTPRGSDGAIVLARMDSSRYPGKPFAPIAGVPMIEWVTRRLLAAGLSRQQVAIATTTRSVDDPLADWSLRQGLALFRGSAEDVADRTLSCATTLGWSAFARVNGDSPLIQGDLVLSALTALDAGEADFVTNLVPRTFPYGVAVEVVSVPLYAQTLTDASPADREHVTAHLYRRLPTRTLTLKCPHGDLSKHSLTVDRPEDRARMEHLLAATGRPLELVGYWDVLARAPAPNEVGNRP